MRKMLLALPLFLLCACSVGPDYVRPATPVHERWNVEYPAAANLANALWWQQFGDPTLDGLIETAIRENLDLRAATARVDQFLGVLDTTRSQYFPQISANYTGTMLR